jgi:hypothetical protein
MECYTRQSFMKQLHYSETYSIYFFLCVPYTKYNVDIKQNLVSGWKEDKQIPNTSRLFKSESRHRKLYHGKESQWFKSFDRPRQRAVYTHSYIRILKQSVEFFRICVLLFSKQKSCILNANFKGNGHTWEAAG